MVTNNTRLAITMSMERWEHQLGHVEGHEELLPCTGCGISESESDQ